MELPPDVEKALQTPHDVETNSNGKAFFGPILKNLSIAKQNRSPICQDTGISIFCLGIGSEVVVRGSIRADNRRGYGRATREIPLRR